MDDEDLNNEDFNNLGDGLITNEDDLLGGDDDDNLNDEQMEFDRDSDGIEEDLFNDV